MTHAMSRLGAMMFLQFFIWGRGSSPSAPTWCRARCRPARARCDRLPQPVHRRHRGAVPVGLIADRYFAAQRILAVLHLAGAVLMWLASTATSFSVFSACVMGYMLLFMPTLALANSVAMRHSRPRSSSRWYAWPAASAGSSQAC